VPGSDRFTLRHTVAPAIAAAGSSLATCGAKRMEQTDAMGLTATATADTTGESARDRNIFIG